MKNSNPKRLILLIAAFIAICCIFLFISLQSYREEMDDCVRRMDTAEASAYFNEQYAKEYIEKSDCFSTMISSANSSTTKTFKTVRNNIYDECSNIGEHDLALHILTAYDKSDIIDELKNAQITANKKALEYLEEAENDRLAALNCKTNSQQGFISWIFNH